jgi:hypothetical protein
MWKLDELVDAMACPNVGGGAVSSSGTPTVWDDALFRQRAFDAGIQSPGVWIFSAIDLKTAADRLNWQDSPVRDDEPSLGLFSVYRMLIGMSLESLLKGIIAAQGVNILDSKGKLSREFTSHKLSTLASKVDATQFVFSSEELRVLEATEPYVIWAGKYPFPKSYEDVTYIKTHSLKDLQIELALWDRLYEHLANIGWIMKMGKKLDLRPKT